MQEFSTGTLKIWAKALFLYSFCPPAKAGGYLLKSISIIFVLPPALAGGLNIIHLPGL